jgi:hypothetical protein
MDRLKAAEGGRINKMNQLVITSDEHRERQVLPSVSFRCRLVNT